MKKILPLCLLFFVGSVSKIVAQNYWQQEVKYKIEAKLDDAKHILNAHLQVTYTNHSPNELTFIYFHLWANAFKDNNTEFAKQYLQMGKTDFLFAQDVERGYMDSLSFWIDGKPANFITNEDTIDVGKLILNKPLRSGESITITTPFRVFIPKTFSRLGHDGQQYQITQWYPKPAVYDASGWHPMPYLEQGEFYGDFGSFDVQINLPKNYVVGATGELQNEDEKKFLDTLANHTAAMDAFADKGSVPSSSETKTLHYLANDVHDFAWFADKKYLVLKGNVTLSNKHQVNTWLLFTPHGGRYWKNALPYINNAITYYSKWVGNYPYNNATAVEGKLEAGGGMEYPQITVIGGVSSASTLETVIVHEVGHNWFQGMLGSNERLHPWMDEGINSYYEQRYTREIAKKETPKTMKSFGDKFNRFFDNSENGNSMAYLGYAFSAWKNEDQPCELNSAEYSTINYFGDVYAKTPIMFNYLAHTIGQQEFDSIMHIYFQQFHFKHPQPADIKKVFDDNCKQNLDWFWNDGINSTKHFDLRLKNISRTTKKIGNDEFYTVTVKNNSNVRTPYSISALVHDSMVKTIYYGGFLGEMDVLFPVGNFEKLKIDAQNLIPELDRQNNTSKISGVLRKTEPLQLGLIGMMKLPNKNQISFLPLIGYNLYDGWMPGLLIYNPLLPGNKWEYQLAPMVGLKNFEFTFTGKLQRNWIVNTSFVNRIKAGVSANMFNETTANAFSSSQKYVRIKPYLEFDLRPAKINSSIRQKIVLERNMYEYGPGSKILDFNDQNISTQSINILSYISEDNQVLNPQKMQIQLQQQNADAKLSLTFDVAHLYKKGKYFDLRFFAGFVHNADPVLPTFDLKMSGFSGRDDYLHDNMYIGRSETNTFWAHQMYMQEGGFRQTTWLQSPLIGRSNQLLGAVNLTVDLPINLPFALYGDFGMYSLESPLVFTYDKVLYDGGITFKITKAIQINFPLLASRDFRNNYNTVFAGKSDFQKWANRITFIWNI